MEDRPVPPRVLDRVLVVEDDANIRRLARIGLEMGGFAVDAASDGRTALSCIDDPQRDYVAIVVDLGLPDIGGDEVVARARAVRPGAAIVVCSGTLMPDYGPGVVTLPKPYTPFQLSLVVRNAVEAPRS